MHDLETRPLLPLQSGYSAVRIPLFDTATGPRLPDVPEDQTKSPVTSDGTDVLFLAVGHEDLAGYEGVVQTPT